MENETRQQGGIRAGEPSRCVDRAVELVGHRRLELFDLVVTDPCITKSALVHEQRIARLPFLDLLR